jgi:multidrug efflux pump subunit AcrA (membrane-fusion protein)
MGAADAILLNRDGMQVAIVSNGKAEIRKVGVKRDIGTRIEVDPAVKPGDQVILNPPVNLVDGDEVTIRPDAAATGK